MAEGQCDQSKKSNKRGSVYAACGLIEVIGGLFVALLVDEVTGLMIAGVGAVVGCMAWGCFRHADAKKE